LPNGAQIHSSPQLAEWTLAAGVATAILVALGALFAAMRKNVTIVESFTQYRRRTGRQDSNGVSTNKPITLILRGRGKDNRLPEMVLDANKYSQKNLVIGRESASCNIAIDDPTISRRHATITWSATGWTISDLGSTNGTSLDGQPVHAEARQLRPGQSLVLGKVFLTIEVLNP
jgi:hypothetical protein